MMLTLSAQVRKSQRRSERRKERVSFLEILIETMICVLLHIAIMVFMNDGKVSDCLHERSGIFFVIEQVGDSPLGSCGCC